MKTVGTFVSVGNAVQPFPRIFDMVESVADILPKPILIQYGNNRYNNSIFECVDFIDMDAFSDIVEEADVIIIHAGAGSIMHAIHAGKQPIVVARKKEYLEHVDNHQVEFSSALAQEHKICVASDSDSLRKAIHHLLTNKSGAIDLEKKNALIDEVDSFLVGLSGVVDSDN